MCLRDIFQREIINGHLGLDIILPSRCHGEGFRTAAKEDTQQSLSPQISQGCSLQMFIDRLMDFLAKPQMASPSPMQTLWVNQ